MGNCKLPITISVLACAIADNRSNDEIDLLAALFTQLGDTLATISTQGSLDDNNNKNIAYFNSFIISTKTQKSLPLFTEDF